MSRQDDERDGPADDRPMTLGEHLDELRKRMFLCVVIAAIFCVACAFMEELLLGIALAPVHSVIRGTPEASIVSIDIGEQFLTGMKVDIVAGLFLSAPLILYVLWGFVASGLHRHERRYVRIFAPVSYVLFLGGCSFFYFIIQPVTLGFLLDYHTSNVMSPAGEIIPVQIKQSLASTVGFFLTMTLVTGLMFEMPLVMLFLQAIRICTWHTYAKFWKHFVVGLLVFSAVITPTGDAFTLALFMAPVLVLFFGGLAVCRIVAPKDI